MSYGKKKNGLCGDQSPKSESAAVRPVSGRRLAVGWGEFILKRSEMRLAQKVPLIIQYTVLPETQPLWKGHTVRQHKTFLSIYKDYTPQLETSHSNPPILPIKLEIYFPHFDIRDVVKEK